MAFQGKGIFDGFSGKVGNIVGYKRGGISVIQKMTTRASGVVYFLLNFKLKAPDLSVDCIVFGYSVKRYPFGLPSLSGVSYSSTLKNLKGGISCVPSGISINAYMGISDLFVDYNWRRVVYKIWFSGNKFAVRNLTQVVFPLTTYPANSIFYVELIRGNIIYSIKKPLEKKVAFFSVPAVFIGPPRCLLMLENGSYTLKSCMFSDDFLKWSK